MSSQFRVELASEDEIPNFAAMMVPSFAQYSVEQIMGNFNTPAGIKASTERHIRACREHMAETGRPSAIKCVETTSGEDKMVACAYWFVFDKPRSAENAKKESYLLSGSWLPEENGQRDRARKAYKPTIDTRIKWTIGRGHAILMYMCTDPAWQRRGAATACVQWGIDLCTELGIPAYLEASEEGAPVYERLGFEFLETIEMDTGDEKAVFPAMMWWPPGTRDENKKPLDV